jgi:hypothetical protein
MTSSILVNCPWGSACSCSMAPLHFRPPIDGPVLSLHRSAPLPVPSGPPVKGPASNERELPSWWTAVGLSTLQSWGPIYFRPHFMAPFWVLSPCTCWLLLAVEDEGLSTLLSSSQILPRGLWPLTLCPHPDKCAWSPASLCYTRRQLSWPGTHRLQLSTFSRGGKTL